MILGPEHEEMAELLGAYTLDAVEDDDARRIERHLAACPRCRAETDQLRQVAAALGTQAGLEAGTPPQAVWDRIAERIGAGAGAPSRRAAGSAAAPSGRTAGGAAGSFRTTGAAAEPLAAPAPVVRLDDHRDLATVRRRRWAGAIASVAAAAVVVALAVGLVQAEGRINQLQSAQGALSGGAVRAALASPGHRVVSLRTSGGAAVARLVLDRNGAGYVVSSTMPVLRTGRTYQLWASIGGRPISLGLLGRRPSPGAAFSLGGGATGARELMVTVEPAGGVVAPGQTPIATGLL